MGTIDITITLITIITAIIPPLVTMLTQKNINKKYVKFIDLQFEFLSSILKNKKKEKLLNMDEYIDDIMKNFKKSYCKMLEIKHGNQEEISIVLRKYVQNNGYLVTVYYLQSGNIVSNMSNKSYTQLKKDMVNLYINNGDRINEIFKFDSETSSVKCGSYLSYALTKHGKIIGTLSVSSQDKVNERYSYENIKKLIEPMENILVNYIQSKEDNLLISDNQ